MDDTLLLLLNTVLENAGLAPLSHLQEELHLQNDLGMDSFNLAELSVRIEKEFKVDVFARGMVLTIGELKARL